MLQEIRHDISNFLYTTFEFTICLLYKPYKFPTEIFKVMFFYINILGFIVDYVCWISMLVPALENY